MKVKIALTALGALALTAVLPTAGAAADETNTNSHNGFTLIHIGQIDDPLEDVLEHAVILSRDSSSDG
ncbi:hypothetical protein [Streptomyces clavuligerus]|uniref:Small membrane protein n=1 Tax=Streptomyces clavuligerus TaxID=1901 RepID=E2PXM6_STRCL|nr:hypothetical protein [Streptomyces clavuligerus]ANW19136.1 hypothetical protein BB341_13360 [Streptomyces clavuligerus]AXU13719.1 hypothetical protein D1794_13850 [Streptomyces clavuligerus]EFG08116.1 small membrane protein [Streptomyces clavuligerus]MBY6303693.1 hypothetical protein [Streptomyces clavuligerus]QCS06505.1 hypothetical protein CRV15_13285 [Streptomyces clavuligerus]